MGDSSDPQALLHSAAALEKAGRLTEAEAVYQRLLARWPDLPDTWYNLALLQRRAGRFDAALASYQQALDRGVSGPEEVHLNRGVIYSDYLRQDDAAERELQAALALEPAYVPALLNLANLREDFGKQAEASALYEKILALDPRCHTALARYAGLHKVAGADDPLVARLRAAIADARTSPADRAELGFALGKALDSCKAWDAAFAAYAAANRDSRQSAAPGTGVYDARAHERFVDELIATFRPGQPAAARSSQSTRPLFICGMFRSGSTLAEQILAAHSRVTAGGELAFLPSLVRTTLAPFPATMQSVTQAQLEQLSARYLDMLARLFPRGDRVTDKRPDNFLYIGLIKSLFPDARIVHTTRDPLDNCLSIYFLHLDHSMSYSLDLADIAHYYVQYRRLLAHWKTLYGADIFDLDYDRLVHEPRPVIEKLTAFCGLEWEEACLSFEQSARAVKTASVWQVRERLYHRSSGRWRNYAAHVAPLQTRLREAGIELDI
ncbi:MAG TPA: sulfotransferase [Steroidobacteraceae bacterium]|jgi:tetratricopeptide (TPR) repeat protein|nr:sulfotransferase [Steroidobacteraceae bacterium]